MKVMVCPICSFICCKNEYTVCPKCEKTGKLVLMEETKPT